MNYVDICRTQHLSEGDFAAFTIRGHEIVVVWPEGGSLKAYAGMCPHRKLPLRRGYFNGRILTCPSHRSKFDGRNGKGLRPTGCALEEYPLRVHGEMVQVELGSRESTQQHTAGTLQ